MGYWIKHVGMFSDVASGDFRATIDMQQLADVPHLYALGPVEGQTGEITVFDGRPDIAMVEDDAMHIQSAWPCASFLVYASVRHWQDIALPLEVNTLAQLETLLGQVAADRGLARPFPFLIEGTPEYISYHIAAMKPGERLIPGQARRQARFSLAGQAVALLGFYSDRHYGVFTHPGKNIHVHFTSLDRHFSGHVDEMALRGGTLRLPIVAASGGGTNDAACQ